MHIPMQNIKVQFFPHLGEKTSKIVLYSYKNRFWCLYLCTNQIILCKWWVMTMNSYALTDALNGTYFPLNKPTHISSFLTLTQPFWLHLLIVWIKLLYHGLCLFANSTDRESRYLDIKASFHADLLEKKLTWPWLWEVRQQEFLKATGRLATCPQFFITMDSVTDKKKEQIKTLIEKMKQEGKPIDWVIVVLCWSQWVLPGWQDLFIHLPWRISLRMCPPSVKQARWKGVKGNFSSTSSPKERQYSR